MSKTRPLRYKIAWYYYLVLCGCLAMGIYRDTWILMEMLLWATGVFSLFVFVVFILKFILSGGKFPLRRRKQETAQSERVRQERKENRLLIITKAIAGLGGMMVVIPFWIQVIYPVEWNLCKTIVIIAILLFSIVAFIVLIKRAKRYIY